jgi:lysophospholipase L1-like esterase
VTNGTLSTAWERKEMVTATYSTPGFLYSIRGDNLTAYGGIAAGARDACLDFVQLDTDGVLREYTPNASQPADVLTVKTAYGARQYGYMRFRSKSNSNQATATAYLWYADADNNLKMSSGGVVTLRLGGANVVVTSGVFNFSKSQPLELYWEYGGGMATLIQARINNGSWINLATMVAVPSPTTQYAVLCSGMDVFLCAFLTSNQNSVPRQSAGLLTLSQKNHVPKIPLPWGEVASSAEIEIEATSGTSIIMVYKNTRTSDTVFSEIQLATDGVHTSYNTLTALSGVLTPTVSGAHRYRIRDGGNVAMWNGTGWTTSAATVQDLMFRGVATQYIAPPKDRRLVVVGDSIATGATSGHITTNGAFQLLRDDPVLGAVYNVTNCSAGNLAVWDLSDPASGQMGAYADSVVSAMDGITQNVVWVELAFNDYYRSTLSAAQFGPIYGQLLDAIHARAPNAVIIAQSPIPANSEAANSKGSQLGAYRTAIADEAAARPWCTYADGSLWTDITRVPDGIHPNQAGHAAYFAHIAATLPA